MNRRSNVPWTDFDKAWKSVEELKGELSRTELKLQNAARTFTWDRVKPNNVSSAPSTSAVSAQSEIDRGPRARPKDLCTSQGTQTQHDVIGEQEVSNTALELGPKSDNFRSYVEASNIKWKRFEKIFNDALLNLSSDGSSVSSVPHHSRTAHMQPSTSHSHHQQQRGFSGTSTVTLATGTSVLMLNGNPMTKDDVSSIDSSSKVTFSQWEREYLNKELPEFEMAGEQVASVDQERRSRIQRDVVQRTTFAYKKPNWVPGYSALAQTAPANMESLRGFHKLREIVARQREQISVPDIDVESDTVCEDSSTSGERKPVPSFLPQRHVTEATARQSAFGDIEAMAEQIRPPPVRKVSVAPPPREYKGFSPIKALGTMTAPPFSGRGTVMTSPPIKAVPKLLKRPSKKKELITPFSWRIGQKLANERLGPPPHAILNQACDQNQTNETDHASDSAPASSPASPRPTSPSIPSAASSNHPEIANETIDLTDSPEQKSEHSAKSDNKENTSPDHLAEARRILDLLDENDSAAEITDEDGGSQSDEATPSKQRLQVPVNKKRKASKALDQRPPPQKVRHYDRDKVKEYMEKQKLLRKKRQQEERRKKFEAQQAKKERLQKLYEYQKLAAKSVFKPKPSQPFKVVHDNVKIVKRVDPPPRNISSSSEFPQTQPIVPSLQSSSALSQKYVKKKEKPISETSSLLNITRTLENSNHNDELISETESNALNEVAVTKIASSDSPSGKVNAKNSVPTTSETSSHVSISKASERSERTNATSQELSVRGSKGKRSVKPTHFRITKASSESIVTVTATEVTDSRNSKITVCEMPSNIHPEETSVNKAANDLTSGNSNSKSDFANNYAQTLRTHVEKTVSENTVLTDGVLHAKGEGNSVHKKTSLGNTVATAVKTDETDSRKYGTVHEKEIDGSSRNPSREMYPETSAGTAGISKESEESISNQTGKTPAENMGGTLRKNGSVRDSNENSPEFQDDSLSGISSLHTASVAKDFNEPLMLNMLPESMQMEDVAVPAPPSVHMDQKDTLFQKKTVSTRQRVKETVQQTTDPTQLPPRGKSKKHSAQDVPKYPVRNIDLFDQSKKVKERIDTIKTDEEIAQVLFGPESSYSSSYSDKSFSSATASKTSTFVDDIFQQNPFKFRQIKASAFHRGGGESNVSVFSKQPDPHNFINTYKRKPLVIYPLREVDKNDEQKGPVLTKKSDAKSDSNAQVMHTELDSTVQEMHSELDSNPEAVHSELNSNIEAMHRELDSNAGAIHSELDSNIGAMHSELDSNTLVSQYELDSNIHESQSEPLKFHEQKGRGSYTTDFSTSDVVSYVSKHTSPPDESSEEDKTTSIGNTITTKHSEKSESRSLSSLNGLKNILPSDKSSSSSSIFEEMMIMVPQQNEDISDSHTSISKFESKVLISEDRSGTKTMSTNTVAKNGSMSIQETAVKEIVESISSRSNDFKSSNSSSSTISAIKEQVELQELSTKSTSGKEEQHIANENDDFTDEHSEQTVNNANGSLIEEDMEVNTKSASQENVSEYLTPENFTDENARTSTSPEDVLSEENARTSSSPENVLPDEKTDIKEKTVQVSLMDPLRDPVEITRVVTQAATTAATSAIMAVLESQGKFSSKKIQFEKSITPSSKQEYSSDFENTQGSPSDVGSPLLPIQTSSSNNVEENIVRASASGSSGDIKESIISGTAADEGSSISAKGVPSVSQLSVSESLFGRSSVKDLVGFKKKHSFEKKRKRSENVSSPSPASLSDNDSLPSSVLSSSAASELDPNQSVDNLPASDSFAQLTLDIVQKMVNEEDELRARHKLSLWEFQEKALLEEASAKMKWLKLLKRNLREKGANSKLPAIKKLQQDVILRFYQERAQLKCMQETYRSNYQKQQLLLAEKKRLLTDSSSLAFQLLNGKEPAAASYDKSSEKISHSHSASSVSLFEETTNLGEEEKSQLEIQEIVADSTSSAESVIESQNASVTKPSHSSYSKHVKPSQSSTQKSSRLESSVSQSSQQSYSLESILQGLKRLEASKRYLSKKEQRLVQRRKQVEGLLQWQTTLDQEEKELKDLEHKAVDVLEKNKQKSKYYVSSFTSSGKNDTPTIESHASGSHHTLSESISSEREDIPSQLPNIASGSKGTDSVPEDVSQNLSSKSEESSDRISDSIQADIQNSGDSTLKEEQNAGSGSITEDVVEEHKDDSSSFMNETSSPKVTSVSPIETEKPASSGTDRYSDSFVSSNETVNNSTAYQPKSMASIRKRLSTSPLLARSHRRQDSSGSDDSFTISHSETASDQSDIEGRIHALSEELRRRKSEAEKLRKEQKKRHCEQLKDKELALRKQLEAYDKYIQEIRTELELQIEAAKTTDSLNQSIVSVKPQIKQPRVAKSRHLQKQVSVSSDSESPSDRKSSENGSPDIQDVPLLPKERKPHASSSHLAKKLRAIETKDTSDERTKESSSVLSSIQDVVSPLSIQESISSPSAAETTSKVSVKSEAEDLFSKISLKSEAEISDYKESESASTVLSDSNLSYNTEFTSDDNSSLSIKKVEEKGSESSVVNVEEKKTPSDSKNEDNFSDQLEEGALGDADVSFQQDSFQNDKSQSIESENCESYSTIYEGSFEEESKNEEKVCTGSSGCSAQQTKEPAEEVFLSVAENESSFNTVSELPASVKTGISVAELIQETVAQSNSSTSELSLKDESANVLEEKEKLVNDIVNDVMVKVLEDTKNFISSASFIPNEVLSVGADEVPAVNEKVLSSSKPITSMALTDVHKKAAEAISNTLVESLLNDGLQVVFKVLESCADQKQISSKVVETNLSNNEKTLNSLSDVKRSLELDIVNFSPTGGEIAQKSLKGFSKTQETNKKYDDIIENQEWFDDDLISPKNEAQVYDQQLLVRHYPYYYRQIPNKPPPPYTPPSSPYTQSYISSQKEVPKVPESVNVVQDVIEQLNEAVEESIDSLLEGKSQGLSLMDIRPPSKYSNIENEEDLIHKSQMIFRSFIFELTKETCLKIFTEEEEKIKPWFRNQKLTSKPLLPTEKGQLLSKVQEDIQTIMKLKLSNQKLSMLSSMKLGRKKRDFVDTIIINELKEEEPDWINYDKDEFAVKLALTDSIFNMLVDDTVKVFKDINAKYFPQGQKTTL